jgi:hypothetical protein
MTYTLYNLRSNSEKHVNSNKTKRKIEHQEHSRKLRSTLEFENMQHELRLEGILLDFKKLSTDSISAHISKFSTLIDAVIAQQPENQKYDDSKKNRYFLRSLETANIPNENWMGFITSLGKTRLTLNSQTLRRSSYLLQLPHHEIGTHRSIKHRTR